MSPPPQSPVKPPESFNYPSVDPDFIVNPKFSAKYYCCTSVDGSGPICPNPSTCNDSFISCTPSQCSINNDMIVCRDFKFPTINGDGVPTLKTALTATTMAPYVKIAFEEYDPLTGNIDLSATAQTVITMGNDSQCTFTGCNNEICKAAIKSFQYGYGSKQQGNTCRVTIVDEKGSEFATWVNRILKSLEGATTPVSGNLRMKVQFGWYITGGDPTDMCGQDTADPSPYNIDLPAPPGLNNSYLVLSPTMYFIPNWINANHDRNKFIYQVEGIDPIVRSQETFQSKTQGSDLAPMYLTKAIEKLGLQAQPPFRVQFRALDNNGKIIDLQFSKRDGKPDDRACKNEDTDGKGYGPFDVWRPGNKPPLETVNDWLNSYAVAAYDTNGYSQSKLHRVGMTMNYDSTFKAGTIVPTNDSYCYTPPPGGGCPDDCFIPGGTLDQSGNDLPQYGSLIVWADSLIWCNNNLPNSFFDSRLKAVYIVNGGNCGSPVLSFNPSLKWHFFAAMATGGMMNPVDGTALRQAAGLVKTDCRIASSNGPAKVNVPNATALAVKMVNEKESVQQTRVLQTMANLPIQAIEAELVVQGDPSLWLCSPAFSYGRFVGIIFINPFFLDGTDNITNCPIWAANDLSSQNSSICNSILTNKGWHVLGVDHQITDGKYITTLKLYLPAPGAEVQDSNRDVPVGNPNIPNNLGGWDNEDNTMPFGGQFSPISSYAVGSDSAGWVPVTDSSNYTVWIGGGEAGEDGYIIDTGTPDNPVGPQPIV